MANFLALPPEIVVKILVNLGLQDFVHSEVTCKILRNLICDTVQLQYQKELLASRRLDRYGAADVSYHDRLLALKESEKARRYIQPRKLTSESLPTELSQNNATGDTIHAGFLISRGMVVKKWWLSGLTGGSEGPWTVSRFHTGNDPLNWRGNSVLSTDGIAQDSVFDANTNLLVIHEHACGGLGRPESWDFHFLDVRTGLPHSAAAHPLYKVPMDLGSNIYCAMALCGDNLAVTITDGESGTELALINWRTGSETRVAHEIFLCPISFSFISRDSYCILCTDRLEMCDLATTPPTLTGFLFPSRQFRDHYFVTSLIGGLGASSTPSYLESSEMLDRNPHDPFSAHLFVSMRTRGSHLDATLAVDSRALLRLSRSLPQGPSHFFVGWSRWGAQHACFLPYVEPGTTSSHASGDVLIREKRIRVPATGTEEHTVEIFDFNPSSRRNTDLLDEDRPFGMTRDADGVTSVLEAAHYVDYTTNAPFHLREDIVEDTSTTLPYWHARRRFHDQLWGDWGDWTFEGSHIAVNRQDLSTDIYLL